MKKIILLLVGLFLVLLASSKKVDEELARQVAVVFFSQQTQLKSLDVDQLQRMPIVMPRGDFFASLKSQKANEDQLVYLFTTAADGFVLVAGDDLARPILGYSNTAAIEADNLPVSMLKWVEEYKRQIRFLQKHPELKSAASGSEWTKLLNGQKLTQASPEAVSPMVTTTWSQSPYYNDLCPQEYWFSDKAVTGCVATAMAQVMKYHNYPEKGEGIHTYYHSNDKVTYGNLTANFGATTYDWANMPNSLNSSSTTTQINAVATLMLHCGIGVDMNYSPKSSGAWVIEAKSYGESSAEYALKEFFGYKSAYGVEREGKSTSEWISLLKSELDAERPILFAGFGGGSGHAFVADGYDNNNYFHMNWGWGGLADGYYSVDAFEPQDLGTGAGYGSYNDNQCVVIGIEPPGRNTGGGDEAADLRLYSSIQTGEIYQLFEFSVEVDVANFGTNNITVDELGAALFNADGDFVEFIETFEGGVFETEYYYTLTFESEGLSAYPGEYYIGIYYKPVDGNWVAFDNGNYKNFIEVEILSPFEDSEIKLYDSIQTSPDPVIVGQTIRIDTKIANFGDYNYSGQLGAGLFYPDGELAQELEVFDAELEAQKFYSVWYENENVEVEPGEYLIGLVHFPENSDDQIVVAPGDYANPITINVVNPPAGPDSYENNNEIATATYFSVDFEDDYDGFYTTETNIHSEDDVDYYAIDLPSGYDYTILARVHDSYNSGLDDYDFSCDVIWAHSDNGEWSEMYDDEMDTPYVLYNGGTVYFGVLPYFEGIMGTYSIQIEILRQLHTDADEIAVEKNIQVYPNPANSYVTVVSSDQIVKFELFDANGRLLMQGANQEENFRINVEEYQAGLYFLKLHKSHEVITRKIMINE